MCDFGFTILEEKVKAKEMKGSPFYIAPEVLEGKPATKKSDVYAFGIILHFLVTSERVPLAGAKKLDAAGIFSLVLQGARPTLPPKKVSADRVRI